MYLSKTPFFTLSCHENSSRDRNTASSNQLLILLLDVYLLSCTQQQSLQYKPIRRVRVTIMSALKIVICLVICTNKASLTFTMFVVLPLVDTFSSHLLYCIASLLMTDSLKYVHTKLLFLVVERDGTAASPRASLGWLDKMTHSGCSAECVSRVMRQLHSWVLRQLLTITPHKATTINSKILEVPSTIEIKLTPSQNWHNELHQQDCENILWHYQLSLWVNHMRYRIEISKTSKCIDIIRYQTIRYNIYISPNTNVQYTQWDSRMKILLSLGHHLVWQNREWHSTTIYYIWKDLQKQHEPLLSIQKPINPPNKWNYLP